MIWKCIGIGILLLLSISPALMQDSSSASTGVVVYDVDTQMLSEVTTTGLQTIAKVSDMAYLITSDDIVYPWTIKLSPDHSKLAVEYGGTPSTSEFLHTYYIVDVKTGKCCLKLDPQNSEMNDRGPDGVAFSPDSTKLAVAYRNTDGEVPPQIVVFDVTKKILAGNTVGDVVGHLDTTFVMPPDNGGDIYLLNIDRWTADGIGVYGAACCAPVEAGSMQYWTPTEENPGPPDFTFNTKNDTLSTGEFVRIELSSDFPSDAGEGLYVPQNVVVYEAPNALPMPIYFNPDNLSVQSANWVADGQAVLIRHADKTDWQKPGDAYVLLRDGTRISVPLSQTEVFIAGTTDGWMVQDLGTGTLESYRLNGTAVESSVLAVLDTAALVLDKPVLGSSLTNVPVFPKATLTPVSSISPAQPQSAEGAIALNELDPGMLFYKDGGLYNVTANGQQKVMDVPEIAAFLTPQDRVTKFKLSPDGSKLLFGKIIDPYDHIDTFYIADLVTHHCCTALLPAANDTVIDGFFSPDGTQFAVAYQQFNPSVELGHMVIFDLATADAVVRVDSSHFNDDPSEGRPYVKISAWLPMGILIDFERPVEDEVGTYTTKAYLWNPTTDTVSDASASYAGFDSFLATGESITVFSAEFESIISYLRISANPATPPVSHTVYYNPNNSHIALALWIADGQAILVQHADAGDENVESDESYILLRDGTKIPYPSPVNEIFSASTRDGWLSMDLNTNLYIYHRIKGAEIENILLNVLDVGDFEKVSVETGLSLQNPTPFPVVKAP